MQMKVSADFTYAYNRVKTFNSFNIDVNPQNLQTHDCALYLLLIGEYMFPK